MHLLGEPERARKGPKGPDEASSSNNDNKNIDKKEKKTSCQKALKIVYSELPQ